MHIILSVCLNVPNLLITYEWNVTHGQTQFEPTEYEVQGISLTYIFSRVICM